MSSQRTSFLRSQGDRRRPPRGPELPGRLAVAWATLLGALLASTAALASAPVPVRGSLRIDFIDVGQGDAALVTSPSGKTVLIDGGPRTSSRALLAFLTAHTRGPLDLVLLTHRHEDHLGGLPAAVSAIGTRMFLDAPVPHSAENYTALVRALAAREIPARTATRGRTVDLGGGATIALLGPPEPLIAGSRDDINSNSVVVRLTYGAFSVLFMGDAEAPTEAWLADSGATLHATVLKVAHHGSRYASRARFLRAVGARVAIISAGEGNRYGHPSPETLARLARAGAAVYRTDMDGDVTVETDGSSIRLTTAHGRHEAVVLR